MRSSWTRGGPKSNDRKEKTQTTRRRGPCEDGDRHGSGTSTSQGKPTMAGKPQNQGGRHGTDSPSLQKEPMLATL